MPLGKCFIFQEQGKRQMICDDESLLVMRGPRLQLLVASNNLQQRKPRLRTGKLNILSTAQIKK